MGRPHLGHATTRVHHAAEKPAVRNDREDRGNFGIIRSPIRASIPPDRSEHFLVCATSLAALHRRAWNCPEGAENTAIARKGLKSLSASLAVIKELASVHRHVFDPLMAALGTSDSGLFVHNCGSLVCTMASRICIASAVPSASPFSKSWAVCPIVLVTWAIHRTLAWRTLVSV